MEAQNTQRNGQGHAFPAKRGFFRSDPERLAWEEKIEAIKKREENHA